MVCVVEPLSLSSLWIVPGPGYNGTERTGESRRESRDPGQTGTTLASTSWVAPLRVFTSSISRVRERE